MTAPGQPAGMIGLPGGDVVLGSERFYPEERPLRSYRVAPFEIDIHPVTNAQFRAFVAATGHVTRCERSADGPAGSLVFVPPGEEDPEAPPRRIVDLWQFVEGADWRHPTGPDSGLDGLDMHPVVHVDLDDARAYAAWRGADLPTEAEWEYAARGGRSGLDYAWGDVLEPDGIPRANYWIGDFPFAHDPRDRHERTSPVGSFPANRFGLFDMIGNVWEWTADRWSLPGQGGSARCCASDAGSVAERMVLKGGSHLCAANYCQRYRPAARHPQPADSATSHIGFRCVRRPALA